MIQNKRKLLVGVLAATIFGTTAITAFAQDTAGGSASGSGSSTSNARQDDQPNYSWIGLLGLAGLAGLLKKPHEAPARDAGRSPSASR